MAAVWLRVLDGPDRGAVFKDLSSPVTVGREEGNDVQLRDERVSRFHLKIQEDRGEIILTDLQSTNGTRVNGESVQVWPLRPGDIIQIGRTVLLFGSPVEIAARLEQLRGMVAQNVPMAPFADNDELDTASMIGRLHIELFNACSPDDYAPLHVLPVPDLPSGLSPAQAAELAELLQYIHIRLRCVIESIRPDGNRVTLDQHRWQNLLDLYGQIAEYLKQIGEPE